MLFLLFRLQDDCYALDASQIVEILPVCSIKKLSGAPPGVTGLFNYHGAFVPVIDLSQLVLSRPARLRLSTRIILLRHSEGNTNPRLLALIAEHATETMRFEPADFVSPGIASKNSIYLGPIANGPRGSVQRIELNKLLPAHLHDLVFGEPASTS